MDKKQTMQLRWLPLLGLLSFWLTACGGGESGCRPDPAAAAPAVPVRLKRLETSFFKLHTVSETQAFLGANRLVARQYLQMRPGSEAALATSMTELATDASLQKLGRETASTFADSAGLRRRLEELFGRVRHHFPGFRMPPAYTFVSGFQSKDIFVNDSLLVLSLDWFAGPRASYRPDLPQYMLSRYTPAHLLPLLAQNVASKYNAHELTANTVLDAMVHDGKALYFAGQVLPCAPDSLLLGYTARQMASLEVNEARVWGHFLENNLLYSTTPFLVQKYVGERPNVPEIDRTCPGRVGQWVGLQIVRKYMAEHSEVSLARLMAEKNAQKVLNDSHYRPKKLN